MTQDRRINDKLPTEKLVFTDRNLISAGLAHLEAEKAAACLVHARDDVWVGVGTKDAMCGLLRDDATVDTEPLAGQVWTAPLGSAAAAQAAVPAGYKLVPIMPDIAMQQAALSAARSCELEDGQPRPLPRGYELWSAMFVYQAMLAAAPAVPSPPLSAVQYLQNVAADVLLALRNTDREPLAQLFEGAVRGLVDVQPASPPLSEGMTDELRAALTAIAEFDEPEEAYSRAREAYKIPVPAEVYAAPISAAPVAVQAEPVATVEENDIDVSVINAVLPIGTKLYLAAPAATAEPSEILAWAHEDGRVVAASTMESARRDGGAMRSSLSGYTIPLGRIAAPTAQHGSAAQHELVSRLVLAAHNVCQSNTPTFLRVLSERAKEVAAVLAATQHVSSPSAPEDAGEPTLLWDADDPEDGTHGESPQDFANNYANNCDVVGTHDVDVLCAYRGSKRTIRIVMPEEGPVTWSWVSMSTSPTSTGAAKADGAEGGA